LAEEIEVFGKKNLLQFNFVPQKFHMGRPGIESGHLRWETGEDGTLDECRMLWHVFMKTAQGT
jgi:hypothetical protein